MTTLIIILIFAGVYALYNTSKKAELPQGPLERWLRKKPFLKAGGLCLLAASLILIIPYKGLASGILYWFVILSTVGSLIIVLSPLKIFNYKLVLLIFIGVLIAENLIV